MLHEAKHGEVGDGNIEWKFNLVESFPSAPADFRFSNMNMTERCWPPASNININMYFFDENEFIKYVFHGYTDF